MKIIRYALLCLSVYAMSAVAIADDYVIDTEGMHASIQFKVSHLGYSWVYGRFNRFSGNLSYDESAPEAATVEVLIETASVDSNHAERDKHLRGDDFLDVKKYPKATFKSTSFTPAEGGGGVLAGTLDLHGVSKPITIKVDYIGAGKDPWGGYRVGFSGTTKFAMADFDISKDLGPTSKEVELILTVEAKKK